MDDIRQERLSKGSILSLNKRLNLKVNSVTLPEVKLLADNPRVGSKVGHFSKVKDLLIQKLGNISIRCLAYSQRLHC